MRSAETPTQNFLNIKSELAPENDVSAFRRLLAELGGCGAQWTEMLAARRILSENFMTSPWVRRRPQETCLFFQLMAGPEDPLDRILDRLQENICVS